MPDADGDATGGRVRRAAPPLRPRTPLLFALSAGTLLAVVVLLLIRLPGPLDEHTLADQRNGLVATGPTVAPQVAGVSFGAQPVALLFVRTVPGAAAVRGWREQLPDDLAVRVVVQEPGRNLPSQVADVAVVPDPARQLAAAVALPASRDGGAGVGYAVVDAERTTRYATLDPAWAANGSEIATIVRATR